MAQRQTSFRRFICGLVLAGIIMLPVLSGCGIDPMDRLNEQIEAEDVQVRRNALLTLTNLNDPRTVIALTEVFEDDDELRDMAAVGLLKKGREQVTDEKPDPIVEGIAALANNVHLNQQIRGRAAWILGEIGDREAIPALKTASAGKLSNGDPAPLVREQAKEALEKLGYNSVGRDFEMPMGSLAEQELTSVPLPEPIAEEDDESAA
jgi:HEAT repeat protein